MTELMSGIAGALLAGLLTWATMTENHRSFLRGIQNNGYFWMTEHYVYKCRPYSVDDWIKAQRDNPEVRKQ